MFAIFLSGNGAANPGRVEGRTRLHEGNTSIFSRIENLEADMARLGRQRLRLLRELDLSEEWDYGEFRDINHWVAKHLQISWIDAKRRVDAAHAIEELPLTSDALESGELSLDKTVQLTRFVTPENEVDHIKWAKTVSLKSVREAADEAQRMQVEDSQDNDRLRNFGWRPIEGGTAVSFHGALPAEQAALVTKAIDRAAYRLKDLPQDDIDGLLPEDRAERLPQRRADALVMLASQATSGSNDPARANVTVFAPLAALASDDSPVLLEDGTLIHPEVGRRLCCDGRIQTVVENGKGEPIGIGRTSETVPWWLKKQVRYRDRTCTFPGCEDSHFTEAHHIWHWAFGGPTDLQNLTLLCGFHHKAVHEHGWSVHRRPDGTLEWFTPGGRLYGVRLPRPRDATIQPLRPEQQEFVALPS